ncbi:Ribosomal RNA large subunit methyltransferase I [BD1-7 clade bacterium]|uniref:Ribosomal RNA large subunit methyltransferase I n=1 Tax=BD1-7 clade bacterium TaxID=2029982 RepID=A0A5S9QDH6_9GAMM|nr:Ribosomal RNA large subunit methyltransferase I [BD1-7 clade bacterium]
MNSLRISARAEKRLKSGHLWIFSNEVDIQATPLKGMTDGEQVVVEAPSGRVIGYALMNPTALICGRLVGRRKSLDRKALKQRIQQALLLRETVYDAPYYRLFYADGDYLPGLIIDRYGDHCVVQINSKGLEPFQADIAEILHELVQCEGVLFRNDGNSRKVEGLEVKDNDEYGSVPDRVTLIENGVQFQAPVKSGQKTGWFYDHRDNRARIANLCEGKRVLDVFSYVGAWGIQCLAGGANELVSVDASEQALDVLEQNADMNGFGDRIQSFHGNAFDAMESFVEAKEKFDVIVLDPPAFIKRKKDMRNGQQAYRRINELGLRLLEKDGLMVSASCSMHLHHDQLQDAVQQGARHVDRALSLIYKGGHAADHPIHPAIAETEYLKAQIYLRRG